MGKLSCTEPVEQKIGEEDKGLRKRLLAAAVLEFCMIELATDI
jgi:hypothetical protein